MQKSSVYLPESLKRRLASLATRSHRSEADLIRAAVEQIVDAGTTPAPSTHDDPPIAGRLVGVGVGPGDPSLITVAAVAALRRADRVLAPCTSADAIGRAELIVRQAAPDVAMERVEFVMLADPAARAGAIAAACDRVVALLDAGNEVAFVTLGDPAVYSTVGSVVTGTLERRPTTPWLLVPGILAFQAVAAAGQMLLTDEQQSLVVLAAGVDLDRVSDELADPTRTVVLYKGGRRLPDIAERLDHAGRLHGAVLGELVGLPGGRVVPVADVADQPASYLSSVIVPATSGKPAARKPRRRRT